MGKLIVLEGLDGSGKATQAEILMENLGRMSVNARKVSFPDYDSDSSALVKMYLSGKFGEKPGDVNAYAASAFYAVDRFAGYTTGWKEYYRNGGVVVADRYTTSNGVHQCSKLPEDEWDSFLDWLYDFEYGKMDIPKPDLVIYLDMTPCVSEKLISGRYGGQTAKMDIHERDHLYIERSAKAAHYCADRDGWRVIRCDDGENPLNIEEISKEVLKAVKEVLC